MSAPATAEQSDSPSHKRSNTEPASTPIARSVYALSRHNSLQLLKDSNPPCPPDLILDKGREVEAPTVTFDTASLQASQSCPTARDAVCVGSSDGSRACSEAPHSLGTESKTTASLGRSHSRKRVARSARGSLQELQQPLSPQNVALDVANVEASRLSLDVQTAKCGPLLQYRTCSLAIVMHIGVLSALLLASPLDYLSHSLYHAPFVVAYALLWHPSLLKCTRLPSCLKSEDPLSHLVCADGFVSSGITVAALITWRSRRALEAAAFDATQACWRTPFGCLTAAECWRGNALLYGALSLTFLSWTIWYLYARIRYHLKPLLCIFSMGGLSVLLASVSVSLSLPNSSLLALFSVTNLIYCLVYFLVPRFYLNVIWDHVGLAAFLIFVTTSVAVVRLRDANQMTREAMLLGVVLPVILSNSLAWLAARTVHGACKGSCLPMAAPDVRRRTFTRFPLEPLPTFDLNSYSTNKHVSSPLSASLPFVQNGARSYEIASNGSSASYMP